MAAADLSNLSIDDDDFEVISGVDGASHSIYPTINDSLVFHPMLVSTTTLTHDDSIKDVQSTLGPAKQRQNFSIASSHSSDGIAAILRAQEESLALTEKHLQDYSILHESLKSSTQLQSKVDELTTKNEKLENELEESLAQMNAMAEKQLREFSIIEEAMKKSSTLKTTVDELKTCNEKLEQELENSRAQTNSLTEKQLREFSMMQESVKKSSALQATVDELKTWNKNLVSTIEAKDEECSSMMKEMEQYRAKTRSLEEEQQKQQFQLSRMQELLETANDLQSKVDELQMNNMMMEKEMTDANARALAMAEKHQNDLALMHEYSNAASQHQARNHELSMNNEMLERELEETRALLGNLERDVREEVNEELRKKDKIISSLRLQVLDLDEARKASEEAKEQQLRRVPSFDEVEKTRQDNAILQKKIQDLNKHLAEANAINEAHQRTVDNLLSKSDDASLQKHKVRELEALLSATKAEAENNQTIIMVLKEENDEGTRILADQNKKIQNMKRTLEKYGHFVE